MPDTRHPTDARRIAPAVDPAWAEEFVLEARLRDVPGHRIGDALAEVDTHCRDSGEQPHAAFGDPTAYARTVAETFPAPRTPWWPHLAPLAVEIVGMITVITAVGEIARGGDVTLTWGLVAALALLAAGCALLVRSADRLLELVVRKPLVAAVAAGVGVTTALVPSALLLRIEAPITAVPAPAALGAGLLLLAGGVTASVVLERRGRTADPLVDPREAAPPRRVSALLPWTVLAWTAVGSVVVAVIGATSGG